MINIKNSVIFILVIILCLLFTLTIINVNDRAEVYALDNKEVNVESVEKIVYEMFGDVKIDSVEYLYGFDESPDYLYINFDNYGYAVYFCSTMELVEYSPVGELPYNNEKLQRKYYMGPMNYIGRLEDKYINLKTNQILNISKKDVAEMSRNIAQTFIDKAKDRLVETEYDENDFNDILYLNNTTNDEDVPNIDTGNLINACPPGTRDYAYVPNAEYFTFNPEHGINYIGTCTIIAWQLVLSYNNYYKDRRIIAPQYLNGGWDSQNNNGNIFDESNYSNPANNPNVCDLINLNSSQQNYRQVISSNNDYYEYIIREIDQDLDYNTFNKYSYKYEGEGFGFKDGVLCHVYTYKKTAFDGSYSFPEYKVPLGELPPDSFCDEYKGVYIDDAARSIKGMLNSICGENSDFGSGTYRFEYQEGIFYSVGDFDAVDSNWVKSKINDGCPLVVGINYLVTNNTTNDETEASHAIVVYGYQDYTYDNNATYSGYVAHFGWESNAICIWVNESWCYDACSLKVCHEHSYSSYENNQIVRCECGYRSFDFFNITNNGVVVGLNNTVSQNSTLEIPSEVNGITVTEIANEAFVNESNIASIILPSTITKIGLNAFYENTQIIYSGEDEIDYYISSDRYNAVDSIYHLKINLISYTYTDNKISITNGVITGSLDLEERFNGLLIRHIDNNAFSGQTQMTEIILPSTISSIGSNAFYNCSNLEHITYGSRTLALNTSEANYSYSNAYQQSSYITITEELQSNVPYRFTFSYENLTSTTTDFENIFVQLTLNYDSMYITLGNYNIYTSDSSSSKVIEFNTIGHNFSSDARLLCKFITTNTRETTSIKITSYTLEGGVLDIETNSFRGCNKLSSRGLAFSLLSNNTYAVSGASNLLQFYVSIYGMETLFIPGVYNGLPVTKINNDAFYFNNSANNRYENFITPVKRVYAQNNLVEIGNNVFKDCSRLNMVNLSYSSVERFGNYAFANCPLKTFKFPSSSLEYIGKHCFEGTNLITSLPDSVTEIDDYAFYGRSYLKLLPFHMPRSIERIGNYAFAECDIIDFNDMEDVSMLREIGSHAFYGTILLTFDYLPNSVEIIGASAFEGVSLSNKFQLREYNNLTTIGNYAFKNSGIIRFVLPAGVTQVGYQAFANNDNLTIYTSYSSKPSGWNNSWNSSNRPVVWGCTLSDGNSYVVSFNKSSSNPSNRNATNGISNPYRESCNFNGWYTNSNFSGTSYANMLDAPNGTLYADWSSPDSGSCVAEGTLITLADGTQVAVEDLVGNENLLVWNMLTGTFDYAPILFIDSDPYRVYEIIHLYFSDGTEVKVISEHGFYDITLNRYVYLRDDAARYIGHYFNKQSYDVNNNIIWKQVQLVYVDIYEEETTVYSPVTYSHLCYYVNGMLSMPGATEGFVNIFEVDENTMTYDSTLMQLDIQTYGLYTYEDFIKEVVEIPEIIFNAFNGQYMKVAMGKGIITIYDIIELVERYESFFSEE